MPLCGTHRGRKGVAGCSAYPLWLLWSSPNEWGLETRFSSQYANFPVPSAGGRGVPACHASPPSAPVLCCRKVRVNHDTPMMCDFRGWGRPLAHERPLQPPACRSPPGQGCVLPQSPVPSPKSLPFWQSPPRPGPRSPLPFTPHPEFRGPHSRASGPPANVSRISEIRLTCFGCAQKTIKKCKVDTEGGV